VTQHILNTEIDRESLRREAKMYVAYIYIVDMIVLFYIYVKR